jgi:murein DD-endopeptidase MepM/ murein hydrolase activator NlpD
MKNDGLNIAAATGEPVRASADGVVTYAGDQLPGYGNLLLVRHADGYVTAYAHNDRLAVRKDEKVRQGQVIAFAGATGNVESPQLHFEIRRGVKAIDPMTFLKDAERQVAGRD